jgi:hypothetical protein
MQILKKLVGAVSMLLLASSCLAQSDDPHIAAIVANLSPAMVKDGAPIHGKSLREMMDEDHVSAVSIAFIRHGKSPGFAASAR